MTYFRDLTKTQAFDEYGAVLTNHVNEYSAIAKDGSVVLECWNHLIERESDGAWRYQIDDLSTWTNNHGKNLLLRHLKYALEENRPVRLVRAIPTENAKPEVAGVDGTKIPKSIDVRKDFVGKVLAFDGNHFVIVFRRNKSAK